ncbi:MAG: S41 family peptidase [Candidatus Woykebacteria bacterium]
MENKFKGRFESFIPKLLGVLIIFLAGIWVGQSVVLPFGGSRPVLNLTNTQTPSNVRVDFAPFWDVWQKASEEYLDKGKVDPQKLLYGAISGMVRAIGDPYTVFLDPDQNQAFLDNLSGTYEGVGIELGSREGRLVVIAPLEGTPSEKAGVRAGDVILAIDGEDTSDMTVPEAVQIIRGEAGKKVKLLLQRKGKSPFEIEMTREKISVKSVRVAIKQDVAVLKLSRFGDNTNTDWDEAVNKVVTGNYKKVILDMRNNPGGRLDQSIYIAGEFLPKGAVVLIQEDSKGGRTSLTSNRDGRLREVQLIVLINEGSASASEIVAGALRDNKKTKLLGEKTFGKGTIQKVDDFQDGSGLHITTAKWLTPSGTWVNEKGLSPDVEVKMTEKDFEKGADPQLARALKALQ